MASIPLLPAVALLGGLGGVAAAKALSPKPSAQPQQLPQPTPTRNMAAEAARESDRFRRRRGYGATELTGGGAEARSPGGKTLLGQ